MAKNNPKFDRASFKERQFLGKLFVNKKEDLIVTPTEISWDGTLYENDPDKQTIVLEAKILNYSLEKMKDLKGVILERAKLNKIQAKFPVGTPILYCIQLEYSNVGVIFEIHNLPETTRWETAFLPKTSLASRILVAKEVTYLPITPDTKIYQGI